MIQFQTKKRRLRANNLLLAGFLSLSLLLMQNPAKATTSEKNDGGNLVFLTIVTTQLYLMNAQAIIGLLHNSPSILKTNDGMNDALTRKLLFAMIKNPGLTRVIILEMSNTISANLREARLENEVRRISALIDIANTAASILGTPEIPESYKFRRAFILAVLRKKIRDKVSTTTNPGHLVELALYLKATNNLIVNNNYYRFVDAWRKNPNVGPKG